jgi:hypothetical protein
MKRILKLLARLYPPAWRNRYGAEFDAVLEDTTPRPQDAFNVLWGAIKMRLTNRNFVRIVGPCAIGGTLIAAAIYSSLPPRFVSQTIFTINEPEPIAGAVVDPVLLSLRQVTLDRQFLASVIQEENLYPSERARLPANNLIDKMLKSIYIRPVALASSRKGDAASFALQFEYSDPHAAQKVESELVSRFIRQNLVLRIAAASNAHSQSAETIRVEDEPSLPQKPAGLNRIQLSAIGLITGLLCGLILTIILGSRHDTTIANG